MINHSGPFPPLTPAQMEVHGIVRALGLPFILGGSAALGVSGLKGHRHSADVDYFIDPAVMKLNLAPGPLALPVDEIPFLDDLKARLPEGWSVDQVRTVSAWNEAPRRADVSMTLQSPRQERVSLDFTSALLQLPSVESALGPVMDPREAVATKISRLMTSAAPEDFVDLGQIRSRLSDQELIDLSATMGIDQATFRVHMHRQLPQITTHSHDRYLGLSPDQFAHLQDQCLDLARELNPDPDDTMYVDMFEGHLKRQRERNLQGIDHDGPQVGRR